MNVMHTLNEQLLKQAFGEEQEKSLSLTQYQYMAMMYARVENAIAVLSDMKADKSYIYHGNVARVLGFDQQEASEEIESIWEEAIFNKIHPEDLLEKHLLELHFFNMIKTLPVNERSDYYVQSTLRMCDQAGNYRPIVHRMFYISSAVNGSLWLALCLYNLSFDEVAKAAAAGEILNSVTGQILQPGQQEHNKILSAREVELLQLIRSGKMSKEIAELLFISVNTVNRHRQNILEKLRVSNSIEACRIAERMKLI